MPLTLTDPDLIHPTAVVSAEADLAPDVRVGPFAIIEGPVTIGPGCEIEGHASLTGPLFMGRDNFVGHGAILGKAPQHRGCKGDGTHLIIGNNNVFREFVTVHRGTVDGGGETRIGDRNYLMVNAHLGHDVTVGNGVTLVNGAMAGGHVRLYDNCILSACAAIQQRARVGRLAMVGGLGSSSKDVPPFVLQQGYNCVSGLNVVGLRRAGFSQDAITALRETYRILYKEGRSRAQALDRIEADFAQFPEVREFIDFIRESTIGINPARGDERLHRTY
jgi:UDP-N-acetylglucosamine acyltransferase